MPLRLRIGWRQRLPNHESKTPLPTRVYNDLWRMSNNGQVVNENGVFRLK